MRVTIPELSLVLLVGPPGSGKSTFAGRHFRPSEVVEFEAMRRLVADDDDSDGAREAAWGALAEIAARRMARGRLTVIDADLVDAARREPLVLLAHEHHCIPVALVFALPEPTCQIQNGKRLEPSASPVRVAERHAALRAGLPGLPDEGFRHLIRFDAAEQAQAAEVRRLPLWSDRRHDSGPLDIVGSVHGRYGELRALLDELGYGVSQDDDGRHCVEAPAGRRLVFLGDAIDHGARGVDVLRLIMDAVDGGAAFSLPGNHEARLVHWLRGAPAASDGGMAPTVDAFAKAAPDFRRLAETFLESSVSHYVFDGGGLVVAHAGLVESLQGRGSTAVREFALHGQAPGECEGEAPDSAPPWVLDYQGSARVVYSHPTVAEPRWINQTANLDTGAARPGGRLTALRYPELEFVSVPVANLE